jgi:hypothetical protein
LALPAVVHGRAALRARSEGPLAAGAAKARIEVPPGSPLAGYAGSRRSAGDGPVYARALVLQVGEVRAIVVAVDALLISGELEEEVLRRARLPAKSCLLLAATHTHSGPGGTWKGALFEWWGNGRYDLAQRDFVAQAAADAVREALGGLRPARVAVARSEWSDGPSIPRSAGPVDPSLTALQARDEAGTVIATLAVYGMHPTVMPKNWPTPSGDWPGAAAEAIEQATETPALVLQGAGGNATWSREGLPKDPAAAADALGDRIAQRALSALALAPWSSTQLSCEVRLAQLPPAQASASVPWLVRRGVTNLLALAAEPFAVETRIGVGELELRGVPGEPVGSLGISNPQLVGLADGYVGYVEGAQRARSGEGESARTYYGPGLARALDLRDESEAP